MVSPRGILENTNTQQSVEGPKAAPGCRMKMIFHNRIKVFWRPADK
jgi:P pilus assembly chaperone PapD